MKLSLFCFAGDVPQTFDSLGGVSNSFAVRWLRYAAVCRNQSFCGVLATWDRRWMLLYGNTMRH